MGSQKRESQRENQTKPKTKEEKMALNINTFSPFCMRSSFDNSFFSNRWNDDWMVPSRNLNKEEAKVEEDNSRMEVRIDASEYKPEELKVSVQSGRLLVEGRH